MKQALSKQQIQAAIILQAPPNPTPNDPLWLLKWQVDLFGHKGNFYLAARLLQLLNAEKATLLVKDKTLLVKPLDVAKKYASLIVLLKQYLIDLSGESSEVVQFILEKWEIKR